MIKKETEKKRKKRKRSPAVQNLFLECMDIRDKKKKKRKQKKEANKEAGLSIHWDGVVVVDRGDDGWHEFQEEDEISKTEMVVYEQERKKREKEKKKKKRRLTGQL